MSEGEGSFPEPQVPSGASVESASLADPSPGSAGNDRTHADCGRGLQRAALGALFLAIIVALWAGATLWRLGAAPFYSKGEPREGLVVWEMTHGGGWILPRRNGTELPSKPPLFHWLGALTSLAAGEVNEATIRFPSALLSLIGLLGVFAAGTAWWGLRTGFFAAVILLTSFEWARAATNARVDMTLTAGLEAAFLGLLAFWRTERPGWLVLVYGGMAWATLGKGPVGIALPTLTALVLFMLEFRHDAWREGRFREIFPWAKLRALRVLRGLFFVLVVAGSWYALALWQGGYAFFRKQILAENLFTFLDDTDFGGGHRHGLLYLPGQLLLGFLPWSLLLPLVAVSLWRTWQERNRLAPELQLLSWVVVVFSFYQLAASKRGVYLLALYPALALLTARAWAQWEENKRSRPAYAQFLAWVASAAAVLCAFAALAFCALRLGVGNEWVALQLADLVRGTVSAKGLLGSLSIWEALAAITLPGLAFWGARSCFSRGEPSRGLLAVAVAVWMLVTGARTVFLPAYAEQVTLRDFMRDVRARTAPHPVYFYRTFDYQAVYYSFGRVPVFEGSIDDQGPRYLLVRETSPSAESLWKFYHVIALKPVPDRGTPRLLLMERRSAD